MRKQEFKNIKKSLAGFTLIEQVIVLFLTGLIVLISTVGINMFNRFIERSRTDHYQLNELALFSNAIRMDMQNASGINMSGDALVLHSPEKSVVYSQRYDCLIRVTGQYSDTFWIASAPVKLLEIDENTVLCKWEFPVMQDTIEFSISHRTPAAQILSKR